MHELIVESCAIFGRAEIALAQTPVADSFGDAANELPNAGFALWRADLAMQIFAGDDVGCRHRPIFRDLDVFLLEDDSALRVGDLREALFPFDFVVGRDARFREETAHGQARNFLRC